MTQRVGRRAAVRLTFWSPIFLHLLLLLLDNLRLCVAVAGASASRQTAIFPDIEEMNQYRGSIRRTVQLATRSSCAVGASGRAALLRCPAQSSIFVTSVSANRDSSLCSPAGANASAGGLQCSISRALNMVKLRCDDKRRCRLSPSPAAAAADADAADADRRQQDPYDLGSCERLLPHLRVSYVCQPEIRAQFLCADTYATISCKNRQELVALGSRLTDKFQFKDQRCPDTVHPQLGARHCPDQNITAEVRAGCNGKADCKVDTALWQVQSGCARANLLLHFACVPHRSVKEQPAVAQAAETEVRQPQLQETELTAAEEEDKRRFSEEESELRPTRPPSSADSLMSTKNAILLAGGSGALLILIVMATAGCLATRRWLTARRRREEEHLARVNLSKQLPPPSTCLLMPAADALLKLPAPADAAGGQTVSVCLTGLGSPPCSVDAGSDRQSSSTSVTGTSTFLTGTGSGASRAGSIPSPRESFTTYSVQQHHCTTAVLQELDQELGRGMV